MADGPEDIRSRVSRPGLAIEHGVAPPGGGGGGAGRHEHAGGGGTVRAERAERQPLGEAFP